MQMVIDAGIETLILMIAAISADWSRLWASVQPLSILLRQVFRRGFDGQ